MAKFTRDDSVYKLDEDDLIADHLELVVYRYWGRDL